MFLGDILAPAVNTRGEAADLGDAPGVVRFDSINSRGAPGFIANEINLTLRAALTPTALVTASVNFTPRTGSDFALGDRSTSTSPRSSGCPPPRSARRSFVGKFDSVLGIEYRERKSDRRFGITPSLIARYTTGTALGLKVRTKFGANDWLVLALALTNGSNTTEQFHFYDEIDSNAGKTGSGRLAVRLPLPFDLELGVSGSYGAQDRTTNTPRDVVLRSRSAGAWGRVDAQGAVAEGRAPGRAVEDVYGLDLHGGGYLEVDVMLTPGSACWAAASTATRSCGWAISARTSPSPGARRSGCAGCFTARAV